MSATAAQIARVRRMTNEPDTTAYSDADIQGYIEAHKLVDENGNSPRIPNPLDQDEMIANTEWVDTYDLNAAAADIWEEKAGVLSADYDFSADGGSYTRSQAYEQAMKQARAFRSRRSPGAIIQQPSPKYVDTLKVL